MEDILSGNWNILQIQRVSASFTVWATNENRVAGIGFSDPFSKNSESSQHCRFP